MLYLCSDNTCSEWGWTCGKTSVSYWRVASEGVLRIILVEGFTTLVDGHQVGLLIRGQEAAADHRVKIVVGKNAVGSFLLEVSLDMLGHVVSVGTYKKY